MEKKNDLLLSGRERQIMDIVYQLGSASVHDVLNHLPDKPSYSTVRALLRILENKGHLIHKEEGLKYVFYPTISRDQAQRSAAQHLMQTFFNNSVENVVATLLDVSKNQLSPDDLDRLKNLIRQAQMEEN